MTTMTTEAPGKHLQVTGIRLDRIDSLHTEAAGVSRRTVSLHTRWAGRPVVFLLTRAQLQLILVKARALGVR